MDEQRSQQPGAGVRALAFYLPQFHPVPENDAWWGPGFTEWANVVRARPLFDGHPQPNLPADLGFYDLRLTEVREAQAALARAHGISGFVYHHYWFNGRRMLERPFDEVLSSGRPDFPFALCWANEHWTRRWDGRSEELLIRQEYGDDELERHAAWLARAFSDPRYIHVDGRPLFVVYMAESPPGEPGEYLGRLRSLCVANGSADPYLVQAETYPTKRPPAENGCDAEVEFHPHRIWEFAPRLADERFGHHDVFEYSAIAEGQLAREAPSWDRYPCVVPSWDNSPRKGSELPAGILLGADPPSYEAWLREVTEREARRDGEGLVFLNAWNEWAESAYLEPDLRHGRGYLEATQAVLGEGPAQAGAVAPGEPGWDPVAAYHELRERYLETQRDREADLRRGEEAAAATIEHLRNQIEAYRKAAAGHERVAHRERQVRIDAEEWARNEQRARLETQAALEATSARRNPVRGVARRLRAAARALPGAGPAAGAPQPAEAPRPEPEAAAAAAAEAVGASADELEALESRIVWIFGAPRSGTTWLTQLLAHPWVPDGDSATGVAEPARSWLEPPDVLAMNEPYFGEHLAPWTPERTGVAAGARGPGPRGTVARWVRDDPELSDATINAKNAGRPSYVFSDEYADEWRPLMRRFLLERIQAQERRAIEMYHADEPLIAIKEPRGAHAAALLASLLPRSRVICILRDGRDVIDSWLHAHLEGSFLADHERPAVRESERLEFVRREAHNWLARVEGMEAAREAHPEELTRLVRYEDLLRDPAGVMRGVFGWLGVERTPERLAEMANDTSFDRIPSSEVGDKKFHRAAEVGHWRRGLTGDEQALLDGLIGAKLAALGYPDQASEAAA